MHFEVLCQIDADERRRAAFACFTDAGSWTVRPFAELLDDGAGLLAAALVHDEGQAVAAAIAQVAERLSPIAVIAYSEQVAADRVVDALHAGAADYLAWPLDSARLAERLQLAAARSARTLRQRSDARQARDSVHRLSKREREVLLGLTQGGSNKVIARELGISPRTVEIHRANMLGKIGAHSALDAVVLATRAGLISELPD